MFNQISLQSESSLPSSGVSISVVGAAPRFPTNINSVSIYRTFDFQILNPQVGDIVLVVLGNDNKNGPVPSGYTTLYDVDSIVHVTASARVVDGTEGDWQFMQEGPGPLIFDSSTSSRGSIVGILIRGADTDLSKIAVSGLMDPTNTTNYSFAELPATGNASELVFAALTVDDKNPLFTGELSAPPYSLELVETDRSGQDSTTAWQMLHDGTGIPAFSDSPDGGEPDSYGTLMLAISGA